MSTNEIYSGQGGELPKYYDQAYRKMRGHPINCAICGLEFRPGDWVRHCLHTGPGGNYHACIECTKGGEVPQADLDAAVEALYFRLHKEFPHFLDDDQREAYQRRVAKRNRE